MSEDEFKQAMQGVRPLKKVDRVAGKKKSSNDVNKSQARKNAEGDVVHDSAQVAANHSELSISDDYVDMLKPLDTLSYKKPGIQDGVFKKLRLGKYPIEARLDLHRKTIKEARNEVFTFIEQAIGFDLRTVLILHGKGERNIERQAVLKSYVAKWLQEIPSVMAYHSAKQHHGGVGAVYVLLQKSEKMKAKTRERHGGRSNVF